MPEPPSVSLITRFVLENPWPLAIVLAVVGLALLWSGLREGIGGRIKAGGIIAALGAGIFAIGMLVTTAGEHGERVTEQLVNAVVQEDVIAAQAMFADDAGLAFGSVNNPAVGIDGIIAELEHLAQRFTIDSNTITHLRGYGVGDDRATAHLACRTQVEGFQNLSQWVIDAERQDDGAWKVSRVTCISVNGNPARGARPW